jgi:hypothetical protein
MNFWDSLGKGAVWGMAVSIVLAMILVNYGDPTPDVFTFFVSFAMLGVLSGIVTAISLLILMGTVQFINWAVILILGGIGSYYTILLGLLSVLFGWIAVAVVSILIILRTFFANKFPPLFEQGISALIPIIVLSVGFTLFKNWFENITHLELIVPPIPYIP